MILCPDLTQAYNSHKGSYFAFGGELMYRKYILLNECRKADIERVQALYDISQNNKCLNYINEVSEDIVDTENKLQDIRDKISSISDELSRKIVELKVYEGYTFERIADELYYSQRYIQLKYKQCGFIGE